MTSNEQGFYITLPSESSKTLFPDNTPSEYTVRVPRWVDLNGPWEIGLHSLAYTPWNTIQHLDEPISFMTGGKEGYGGKMSKHYSSVQEYVSDIRKSLKQARLNKSVVDKSTDIEFFYMLDGKVKVRLSSGYTLRLRREQAIVLGFMTFEDPAETYDIENAEETGVYKANLYRETNIHVYCDIVHPQIVGDKMSPLVAVVPYRKATSETVYVAEHIRYIPLQTKSFQDITIHLRSSTEEFIPFEHRRVIVTLHLKPLSYF